MGAPMKLSTRKAARPKITPALQELYQVLLKSEKFRKWRLEKRLFFADGNASGEKHFAPDQLAELWGVSAETIRNIFRKEPGVLRFSPNAQPRRRKYITMRIPESVAARVHKRLSAVPVSI
jgi:hypothetical protein